MDSVLSYDQDKYPFRSIARDIFGICLEDAHGICRSDLVTRETDQQTELHSKFYNNLDALLPVYYKFVKGFIEPRFGPIVYQSVPTFRVQLPNNLSVGERHRDTDYGHSSDEINFLVPLTKMERSNSIYIESGGDVVVNPRLQPGQVFTFKGSNYHFNVPNQEGYTRMSFDFRVIPRELFKPNNNRSVNTNQLFALGDYFRED